MTGIFARPVVNVVRAYGIVEAPIATQANYNYLPIGSLFIPSDANGVYRKDGPTTWTNIASGGGGTQDWDNVLSQGGVFTADHVADISTHRFALQDAATPAKFLEVVAPGDISMGDLSGVGNGTWFAVDETTQRIRLKANGAFQAVFSTNLLTADRTYQFPNLTGVLALISQVPVITKGISVQSGDGVTAVFNIAHGLGAVPASVAVKGGSQAAGAISWVNAIDATNITIRFAAPPPSAANNLTFYWEAFG